MEQSVNLSEQDIVLKVIETADKGMPVQEALAKIFLKYLPYEDKKRKITDLAYNFFRFRIRLKCIAASFLKKPQKLPHAMLIRLKLASCSLLFQDGMPDYAVINETVKKIKKIHGLTMGKIANAVLRKIQDEKNNLLAFDWYKNNFSEAAAIFYSMPVPVVNLWLKAYGTYAAECLLKRSISKPWTGLRIDPGSAMAEKLHTFFLNNTDADKIAKIGEHGIAIAPGAMPKNILGNNLLYWRQNGAITAQAAGSMLILNELGLTRWQEPVWDCCAGTGGKSLILKDYGVKITVATDNSIKRLRNYPKNVPVILLADVSMPPLKKWNGNILADVPCSGLGVLARRPDIKKNDISQWQKKLAEYAANQLSILNSLYCQLQPQKELAYITCTLNPEENEWLAEKFLKLHPDLQLLKQWQTPHTHEWLEGMYGAVFKKDTKNKIAPGA